MTGAGVFGIAWVTPGNPDGPYHVTRTRYGDIAITRTMKRPDGQVNEARSH